MTRAPSRRLAGLLWDGLVPAAGAFAILRYVFPSRLEGTVGGPSALAARLADEQPLILAILLFILLSVAIHYWRRVISPDAVERSEAERSPRALGRTLAVVAGVAMVALFVRLELVQTYRVEGPSMLPTLQQGDRLLVDKTAYGLKLLPRGRGAAARTPRRGDIVVLRTSQLGASAGERLLPVVKRVLGLPGDRILSVQPGCDDHQRVAGPGLRRWAVRQRRGLTRRQGPPLGRVPRGQDLSRRAVTRRGLFTRVPRPRWPGLRRGRRSRSSATTRGSGTITTAAAPSSGRSRGAYRASCSVGGGMGGSISLSSSGARAWACVSLRWTHTSSKGALLGARSSRPRTRRRRPPRADYQSAPASQAEPAQSPRQVTSIPAGA